MEVNGKEFLRNIGIEEDKQNLEKEQKKLDEQKRASIKNRESFFQEDPSDEGVSVNISSDSTLKDSDFNNLYDIKLNPDANGNNKKKYLILIVSLILLFIITIVVIRMISNNNEESKLEQPSQTIQKDNQLNNIKTNDEYEQIIEKNEKLSFTEPESVNQIQEKKELILPEPTKEPSPVKIESAKKTQATKDIFGLEKEAKQEAITQKTALVENDQEKLKEKLKESLNKAVKQDKKVILPAPEVTNFVKPTTSSKAVKGYFIQIGSFTKKPATNYLKNITSKGYTYTLHKVTVKGKEYNKLLIGSYPSHSAAKQNLPKIKKDLKAPGAYILKL